MKYRRRPVEVEAVQCFKDGDHPDVHEGWLNANGSFFRIYRGMWVVTLPDSSVLVLNNKEFEREFERVEE